MSPELFSRWEHIISDVDKTKIPMEFIKKLVIRFHGRRQHTINIAKLMQQGYESEQIEEAIEKKLAELDQTMTGIEFILDIEAIATKVDPETKHLLRFLGE
jgi:acid phosphatase class B